MSDLDFLNALLARNGTQQGRRGAQQSSEEEDELQRQLAPVLNALRLAESDTDTRTSSGAITEASDEVVASNGPSTAQQSEKEMDEILRGLEQAEHAADGLESRLDKLLSGLDGLLDSLGSSTVTGEGNEASEEAGASSDSETRRQDDSASNGREDESRRQDTQDGESSG